MQSETLYLSMAEVIRDFPNWFSPEWMGYFSCKVESEIINHNDQQYFITSERDTLARYDSPTRKRKFSIRLVDANKKIIETVGEFHSFKSAKAARKFILEQE